MTEKPRLRQLDFQPVYHQGEQMWYLRDPLELSSEQLVMPPALAQLLLFCDGSRTPQEIHADFCQHIGQPLDFAITEQALAHWMPPASSTTSAPGKRWPGSKMSSAASPSAYRPWPT